MNHNYRLPDRLDIHGDESLPGFAMRYAALYGFDNPIDLFARLQVGRRRVLSDLLSTDPSTPDGAAVLDLLNVPQSRRAALSLWSNTPNSYSVLRNELHYRMLHIATRRCCPECISGAPYHRAAWLISALPACATHGALLIDRCPACETVLRWKGTTPHMCHNHNCGFDLRQATPTWITAGQKAALVGLVDLLSGGSHPIDCNFSDALKAVILIGCYRMNPTGCNRWEQALAGSRENLLKVLETGWATITPWPSAFNGYLDELIAGAQGRDSNHGLAQAFGIIARRLSDRKNRTWAVPFLTAMVDRLDGHPEIAVCLPVLKRYATNADGHRRRLTLEQAAKMLGVCSGTADRLARQAGLQGSAKAYHQPRQLRREDVERLAASRGEASMRLNLSQAAAALGVDFHLLIAFVDAGVLTKSQPNAPGLSAWIERRQVDELLRRMEESALGKPRIETVGPDQRRISRGGMADGFGLAKLVPLVLAGKLAPVAVLTTCDGLRKYVFPRSHPAFVPMRAAPKRR